MNAHLSLSTVVTLSPRRAGLCAGRDNEVDVLLRIQAPDAPEGHAAVRPPQAISLVIDRSGSMHGRPLDEAHLHGGWHEGVGTLADVRGDGLKRVILLSDGQANEGLTDTRAIAEQCGEWAGKGVTTSTYGLGNNFNEELMVAMARAGGGNHYYGDTAEDLMEPFQQELELLGNLCLRDLRLAVSAPDGVEVRIVNELMQVQGRWRLPDLAWGAEAWVVLRLTVSSGALLPTGRQMSLLRVGVQGLSLEGDQVQLEQCGLALLVLSPPAYDALNEDEVLMRRLVELAAADVLTQMRQAAIQGNWSRVDSLLEEASRQFAGNEWVTAMLTAMQEIARGRQRERMMKESMYSSSKLRSRLVAKDEDGEFCAEAELTEKPAYLRRKPSQGKGGL